MFRFITQLLCGLFALLLTGFVVLLVLANRSTVTVSAHPLPYQLEMPLYLVIALSFVLGLAIGLLFYASLKVKAGLTTRKLRRQLAIGMAAQKE